MDDYFPVPGYVPPIVLYDQDRDCLATPPPPPPPTTPAPSRFVQRGYWRVCRECGLAEEWCACDRVAPEQPSKDATAAPDLSQRIREARAQLDCPLCLRPVVVCAGRCE